MIGLKLKIKLSKKRQENNNHEILKHKFNNSFMNVFLLKIIFKFLNLLVYRPHFRIRPSIFLFATPFHYSQYAMIKLNFLTYYFQIIILKANLNFVNFIFLYLKLNSLIFVPLFSIIQTVLHNQTFIILIHYND